ncbi:hypothetical protein [Leisingera aquaemixtae]|uniref:Sulfotransferase family protein n=1 Tax=Leisingera aquaemixtae TaxID=1396826 RepID=A0A0P1HXX7_9RHOB|nr:hypothetical protein [Leisingera aquaemixtae]CUI00729.1 hypothetical protein PHA8399_02864 [Leisingera aquaemixtae]
MENPTIICHPLKLIFIKTKKVGGTSIEIALSSFCDETSVITPISPNDETTRADLGYRGQQNHRRQVWPDGTETAETFYNHIPAAQAKAIIPQEIWDSYTKVTIWRDPYDAIISRYYWEKADAAGIPFGKFVRNFKTMLTENSRITPLEGPDALNVYLRYEHLEEDIAALGIDGLWERFSGLRAKGAFRPRSGADPDTLNTRHPGAADIVAEQCATEIRKFGYKRPSTVPAMAKPEQAGKNDFIFTLSAGRTGTAWLAQFLGDNLQIRSVHEPLGVEDFGTAMPEFSHMRRFNTLGMDGVTRDFWRNKLASLQAPYAESNHILGKCGLIEALADSSICSRTTVIILRRDLAKQCASYVGRNDFQNITIPWQWYLDMSYRNVIVNPSVFRQMGQIGWAIWYALEMEARYAYYLIKYGGRINFVEARLEEATKPDGAARLLEALGHHGAPVLPEKKNATRNQSEVTEALTAEIRTLLGRLNFDPVAQANAYLSAGRTLDGAAQRSAAA